MKKRSIKITILCITIFSVVCSFTPLSLSVSADSISNYNQNQSYIPMSATANKLATYFGLDESGNVTFNVDRDTLVNELGISPEDVTLMFAATEELPKPIESIQVNTKKLMRGFVGVYMNLGPKVRKMNGWAAGAFAGGYVGWYAKNFAVNPITAGVGALITASAAASAKYAVENNLRRISLGRNIAGWSWSFNVNIP
ncbi:hypothetical protein [Carnobacterium sp.]|uniref:hypothetical protein n=1 Tax=Carnobacterium TaxID=2747 RepID=UPI002FC6068A